MLGSEKNGTRIFAWDTEEVRRNCGALSEKGSGHVAGALPGARGIRPFEAEAIEYVATLMEQTPARVHGVVSFYTMFNMKPIGRHHIQVCRTLSCALGGAEKMTAFIKQKLGIEIGQTTADGRFTLSEVECLASCGTAPMMQINDEYYENLNEEKVDGFWKT